MKAEGIALVVIGGAFLIGILARPFLSLSTKPAVRAARSTNTAAAVPTEERPASSAALEILSFDVKPMDEPGSKLVHFSWRVDVRNNSSEKQKIIGATLEFYDANKFKVTESAMIGPYFFDPGETESISDRSVAEPSEWEATATYKVRLR